MKFDKFKLQDESKRGITLNNFIHNFHITVIEANFYEHSLICHLFSRILPNDITLNEL